MHKRLFVSKFLVQTTLHERRRLRIFRFCCRHFLLAPVVLDDNDVFMIYGAAKNRYAREPVRLVVSKVRQVLQHKYNFSS